MDVPTFSAWSLLSPDCHGTWRTHLSGRTGRPLRNYGTDGSERPLHLPGDLAVIRDNRIVFGAGWIRQHRAGTRPQDQIPVPECSEHGL